MKTTFLALCGLTMMMAVACRPSRPVMTESNTYVDSIPDSEKVEKSMAVADTLASTPAKDTTAVATQEKTATKPQIEKRVLASSEDGYVNVRLKPTVSSDTLGRLLVGGESAEFLGIEGEWYHVRYHGKEGYVKRVYAKVDSAGINGIQQP